MSHYITAEEMTASVEKARTKGSYQGSRLTVGKIARALSIAKPRPSETEAMIAWRKAVLCLADALRADHPEFNETKFRRLCEL